VSQLALLECPQAAGVASVAAAVANVLPAETEAAARAPVRLQHVPAADGPVAPGTEQQQHRYTLPSWAAHLDQQVAVARPAARAQEVLLVWAVVQEGAAGQQQGSLGAAVAAAEAGPEAGVGAAYLAAANVVVG